MNSLCSLDVIEQVLVYDLMMTWYLVCNKVENQAGSGYMIFKSGSQVFFHRDQICQSLVILVIFQSFYADCLERSSNVGFAVAKIL